MAVREYARCERCDAPIYRDPDGRWKHNMRQDRVKTHRAVGPEHGSTDYKEVYK
jgi:hypothetical protein